jgi:hypothetical protein
MSKWLEQARSSVAVPRANSAKTAETPTFGANGTFDTPAEDTMAAFEERAAVCEYDGGLPRSHAELMALACTVPLAPNETCESRDAIIIHFADYLDRARNPKVDACRTGSALIQTSS